MDAQKIIPAKEFMETRYQYTYKPFLHFQLKNLGLLGLRKCSSLRNQEKKSE